MPVAALRFAYSDSYNNYVKINKYFRVSLATVKSLFFRNRDKGSGEDEIRTIFLKSDTYDAF